MSGWLQVLLLLWCLLLKHELSYCRAGDSIKSRLPLSPFPPLPQQGQWLSPFRKRKEAEAKIRTALKGSLVKEQPSRVHFPPWKEVMGLPRQGFPGRVSFPQTEVEGSTLRETSPQGFIPGGNSTFCLHTSSVKSRQSKHNTLFLWIRRKFNTPDRGINYICGSKLCMAFYYEE